MKNDLTRVLVIGPSGIGKTTLGRRLAGVLAIQHKELDRLYRRAGKNVDGFRALTTEFVSQDRWVIDGNRPIVRDLAASRATTVIWLNYRYPTVVLRRLQRTSEWIRHRRNRSPQRIFEQLVHVASIGYKREQVHPQEYLIGGAYPNSSILEFRRPRHAEAFLESLAVEASQFPAAETDAKPKRDEVEPAVSVVVPCYNEEGHIASALERILDQDVDLPYEVIVVDSSSDRTADIVRGGFPSVVLVHQAARLSCGEARNRGLRHARGERILFTDADVRVPRGWVRRLAQGLEEADAVGGSLKNGTPWSLTGSINYYLEFCRLLPERGGRVRRGWGFFAGANAGYRRAALEGMEFLSNIGEDIILNHGLLDQGRELRYCSAPAVQHVNKRGFRRVARYQFSLGVGGWRWRRQSGRGNPWVMRWPVLMIGSTVFMIGYLLWRQARNLSPIGLLTILGLSPFLAVFHGFWVAGFVAGERVCSRDPMSERERGADVLPSHGEVVSGGQKPASSSLR